MDPALQWTRAHIPTLDERRILISGANSGIGFEAARLLAARGAAVTLACRDGQRGRDALVRLRAATPDADVDLLRLDLADLASIREAAERWSDGHDRLDVLVNNAGVMAPPLRRTVDGFELQFGVNHLGHFALTGLLLDAFRGDASRVVTVASGAHRTGTMAFDDLNWTHRRYRPWPAYGQSKLANLLFTFELQRRSAAAGLPVDGIAAHPGLAATGLQGRGPRMRGNALGAQLTELASRVLAQDAARGALPTVVAAASRDARGGDYWGPAGRFEMRGRPARVPVDPAATDLRAAAMLWDRSEELTGVRFEALRSAAS
ncbi:MAG TPA: oxidoreductase [Euzebyales bacterium]|nr:oxidoreductase [Euzebyales bacterium]